MKPTMKPILCLDFDGVIHSYTSGWKGATVIPDPATPGAIEFILEALNTFEVAIFSSRSHQFGGRRAMKKWLKRAIAQWQSDNGLDWSNLPFYVQNYGAPPGYDEAEWPSMIIQMIRWPIFKPPATITLDDRAVTFTGAWPAISELQAFKPWNK
jgi:hypothetical protein